MENILNRHQALIILIVISSICQKFLKTSLDMYRWQFTICSIHHLVNRHTPVALRQNFQVLYLL